MRLTKNQVNRAGETLRTAEWHASEFWDAFRTLQEWRNLHEVPLHSLTQSLRQVTRTFQGDPLVARRLKRAPTIVDKLRASKMALARMHDIAGARVILDDCIAVHKLIERLDASRIRHDVVRDYDYLSVPKPDGYRSYHRVYRFKGAGATVDHDGLLVEVQLRTRTQHAWATTVETVGTFLRQPLKRREGDEEWLSFFRHVGSAFAHLEGESPDPELKFTRDELFEFVRDQAKRLAVKRRLEAFTKALEVSSQHSKYGVFLLHLRGSADSEVALALDVRSFRVKEFATAEAEYRRIEESAGPRDDVVLVSAATTAGLRRAYPNYFLDTNAFLTLLDRVSVRPRRRIMRPHAVAPQLQLPFGGSPVAAVAGSMPSLGRQDQLLGSRVLTRILWALELGRRASMGPLSAAAIAQLLQDYTEARMFATNVNRFFRETQCDSRTADLWVVDTRGGGRRFTIAPEGRRLLLTIEGKEEEATP